MKWLSYLFILLCGSIDILVWGTTYSFFPYTSRALFYTALCKSSSWIVIVLAGFLSLFPLFFLTGSFGIDLFLIIPLGLLFYVIGRHIELNSFYLWGAVFCAVVLQNILDRWVASVSFDWVNLLAAFLSSILVVYFYPGSQGNRSLR